MSAALTVEQIRADSSRRWSGSTLAIRWPTSTGRRHPGAARRRRCDPRLPAAPQCQHPLGVSDVGRDRRVAAGGAPHLRRLLRWRGERGRLRQQHDDDHLPCGPGTRARLERRRRDHRHRTRPPRQPGAVAGGREGTRPGAQDAAARRRDVAAAARPAPGAAHRRAPSCWRSVPRRTRSAPSRTWPPRRSSPRTPARSSTSMACTTRRITFPIRSRSARTSSPAARTSSTARMSACCGAGIRC